MPKVISSFGSSTRLLKKTSKKKPELLEFPLGWGNGPVFDWYKNRVPNKTIQLLQIRKDEGGAVPHRFIMVHMSDDRIHRFDRRPEQASTDHTPDHTVVDLLVNHAVKSEDTYIPDVDSTLLSEIERFSHCEVALVLDGRVDLLAVIAACYAISEDDSTREYTFLRHNCFFFSWAILMVVSRHCLPYELPRRDPLMQRFISSSIDDLTSFIVEEAVALFLDLVIDTIIVFREKAGDSLNMGMSMMIRTSWALPIGLLRVFWRQLFTIRLHLGLRQALRGGVERQLTERVPPIYEAIVSTHGASDLLDSSLWIEEVKVTVEPFLRKEVAKILWDAILDAISSGLGDITPEKLAKELNNPKLKFSVLGKRSAQFYAVWNAALHGGMPAAKGAIEGNQGNLSDEAVFDKAWSAAKDASLHAAQTVVNNTRTQIRKPVPRDAMWASIWRIWDDSWEGARQIVQPKSLATVKTIVEKIISTALEMVVQEIKDSKDKTIQARVLKVGPSLHPSTSTKV
jgi:hypothetical protein